MRPSVAVALIVMGSLIVITPVVTNYFEQAPYQANAMKVVVDYKADPVNKLPYLQQRYPTSYYSYGCLISGHPFTPRRGVLGRVCWIVGLRWRR